MEEHWSSRLKDSFLGWSERERERIQVAVCDRDCWEQGDLFD